MRLVIISHTECFEGEAAILNSLFAEGMACFHLRKPLVEKSGIRQLLDAISPAYRPQVALHQFHELAGDYGITRLHFTERHRLGTAGQTLADLTAKGYVLTTSVHSIPAAQQLPQVFSYAFFGPVFNSISKEGYHAIVKPDFYWPSEQKAVPMIALGGIDAANIGRVAAMNFDAAALLGVLWKTPGQAIEKFRTIQQLCRQHAHT